jgi:hypothetical protein
VPTERIAQSREQFICTICFATRAKTLIQRGCQDVSGHGLVDGGFDRPAPSPESDTRPANGERAGSATRAVAVRSSSHDAITLPRRHTSAMSGRLSSYWSCSGLRNGVVAASTFCGYLPTLAARSTSSPSAYAAMMPYSIPLCTIVTKWPAPFGPQWR